TGQPLAPGETVVNRQSSLRSCWEDEIAELLDAGPMSKWRHDLYRERTGKTITAGPEMSKARNASTDELEMFQIDVPDDVAVPVLVLRTVYSDEDGPLEVWEDILRPGMWHPRN
ncbi:GntR family transcriptional regulator, partial [Streptomyces sp. NRRL F-6602]